MPLTDVRGAVGQSMSAEKRVGRRGVFGSAVCFGSIAGRCGGDGGVSVAGGFTSVLSAFLRFAKSMNFPADDHAPLSRKASSTDFLKRIVRPMRLTGSVPARTCR